AVRGGGWLGIYGDSYLPIDYREVVQPLADDPQAVGVAVVYDNSQATTVPNNIALEGEFVTRYAKDAGPTEELRYVEAGGLAFRRSVLPFLPPGRPVSLEKEVFPELIARRRLLDFVTRQRFYDIGTPERLALIERCLVAP